MAASRIAWFRPMALSESVLFCMKGCIIPENNASTEVNAFPIKEEAWCQKEIPNSYWMEILLQHWEYFGQPLNCDSSDIIEKYD